MYSNLTTASPNIQASQVGSFFKDAAFGVLSGNVGTTQTPEPGMTIVRDSQFGVSHIYGDTRAELMFGIGYATGEDRLFFIDALRPRRAGRPGPQPLIEWVNRPTFQQADEILGHGPR